MTDPVVVDATSNEETDAAKQAQELAGFWIDELAAAEKETQSWRMRAKKITKKYRDERALDNQNNTDPGSRRYCILYSNVETIAPAVYARPPKAAIQRRWKEKDPVSRVSAMILERAANFTIDCYDLDGTIKECRKDYLLTGQGTAWVRYEPTLTPQTGADGKPTLDENGDAIEDLEYERVCHDHVNWDDFFHSVSRTWQEVWWVARRTFQTRAQLIAKFGKELGDLIPLDWGTDRNSTTGKFEKKSRAAIYEIWSKRDKKVYFVSRSYGTKVLEERAPNYKLEGFFPCPKPCFGTTTTDTLVPVPDYVFYQDQAEEIDDLTARIGKLTDALKVAGFYAGKEQANLQQLFSPTSDMTMIPVENWAMLADGKGIAGLVDWFPVEQVIKVLDGCVKLRAQLIQDIYQITGISDIVRGATDPNETARAQEIKSQWGGLRVRDRQQDIQRFARDIIQIESEIIAQLFQPQTLSAMTGVQLPTDAEKAQLQQQLAMQAKLAQEQAVMAQAQQPPQVDPQTGQPMPPQPQQQPEPPQPTEEQKAILESPTWEEVTALLRNNQLRDFKIDIETDSTIQPDEQAEKEARTELLQAVGQFLAAALPVIQSFPMTAPMFGELLMQTVRAFRAAPQVEDVIEESMQAIAKAAAQPAQPQPDPLVIKAETEAKITEAKGQQDIAIKGKTAETDIEIMRAKAAEEIKIKRAMAGEDMELNRKRTDHEIETGRQKVGAEIHNKGAQSDASIQHKSAAAEAAAEGKAKPEVKAPRPKRITIDRGPDGKIAGATVSEEAEMPEVTQ